MNAESKENIGVFENINLRGVQYLLAVAVSTIHMAYPLVPTANFMYAITIVV